MKKLLAFLLSIIMMTTFFVGCGDEEGSSSGRRKKGTPRELTAESLEGTWTIESDMTNLMQFAGDAGAATGQAAQILDVIQDMDLGVFSCRVDFVDGVMRYDEESYIDAMNDVAESMIDWLRVERNFYEFMAKSTGLSVEQVKVQLASNGKSVEDYIEMLEEQFLGTKGLAASLKNSDIALETYYEVKDGKIYSWGKNETKDNAGYYEVEYTGNEIDFLTWNKDGKVNEFGKGLFVLKK